MTTFRKPHPTHLAESGLTLEEAESLLRRPYGSLRALERHIYVLLEQTPEERKVWVRDNFQRLADLGLVSQSSVPKD